MKRNLSAAIALCALLSVILACNASFTTANISKLAFGKNDKAEPETTSFDAGEKIYAVATVSNTSQKMAMTFKVTAENVPGRSKGDQILSDKIDFEGARPIWYAMTLPAGGEYKVEATISDESGKQVDQKSGTVTVKGSAAPASSNKKEEEGEED